MLKFNREIEASTKYHLKELPVIKYNKNIFFNKWNNCCANSILQALSVLPFFYSQESFEHDTILPCLESYHGKSKHVPFEMQNQSH